MAEIAVVERDYAFKDSDLIDSVEVVWRNGAAEREFFINDRGEMQCDSHGQPHIIPEETFRRMRSDAEDLLLAKLASLDRWRRTNPRTGQEILNYKTDRQLAEMVRDDAKSTGLDPRTVLDRLFENVYSREGWRRFRILKILYGMKVLLPKHA